MYEGEDRNRDKEGAGPAGNRDPAETPELVHAAQGPSLTDRIDRAIDAGLRRGQAELERRRVRFKRRIGGLSAACLLFVACVFTIRVSPAFADIVRDIPGFEKFVDLIRDTQDQGIELALDNDFVQKIGISDEHEGMKLTVQGIIADDSRMVLFYEIQLPDKESDVKVIETHLTDGSGENLPSSMGYTYSEEAKEEVRKTGVLRESVDINLAGDGSFPDELIWKMKLLRTRLPDPNEPPMSRVGDEESGGPADRRSRAANGIEFQVRFPIDREKFAGLQQTYPLNKTIDVEGQKITFAKAVVSPLRVSLYLDYDEANDKQVFGPGDIRLIDDQGTEWKQYLGNMVKNHPVYHFESPYFNQPKSLHIEGSWFRALDRSQMQVTVNTDEGVVLQAPDDRLSLDAVVPGSVDTKLDFKLHVAADEDRMMYSLFEREFRDADGRIYAMSDMGGTRTSSSFRAGMASEQHVYYTIDNETYKQPLTFTIYSYPQYIRQPYRIRIK